jgi:hypothetical protein
MSAMNFLTKPSVQALSDDAFVWACKNIGGRDAVEFISYGVWPLSAGVNFEHVEVGLNLASRLKVLLPHFSLLREDGEDDAQLLARVEQEARNIVGSYTRVEHKVCVANLPNNGHLNHALEVAGVSYGPRPVPVSTEVLKKRKADATAKVSGKRPKVTEKKGVTHVKVSGSRMSVGSKRPLGAVIVPTKSAKLSKCTVPHAIASVAVARIMPGARISEVLVGVDGAKRSGKSLGFKTVSEAKAAPSAKKHIIPAIGALAALSSDGTEESSPHDQAPEVQSKVDPHGPSMEPQARSATISGP